MKPNIDFLIENINLKENAQFYRKNPAGFYSRNRILNIFNEVAINKSGHLLMDVKQYEYEGIAAQFSICVFKTIQIPSFILGHVNENWLEHKLSYLLLFDFKNYVVMFSKGVSNSRYLDEGLTEISYKILTTIYIEDETVVEKVALNNTNIQSDAVRKRTVEANNLGRSMSTYGLGKYIAYYIRLNNASAKTSVVPNASRINNNSEKTDIYNLLLWSQRVIGKIEAYVERETFIDVFAEPIEYTSVAHILNPISILVLTSNLQEDYDNGKIRSVEYRYNGITKNISFAKLVKHINQVYDVSPIEEDDGKIHYVLDRTKIKEAELVLNSKSIILKLIRGARIYVQFDDAVPKSLISYLNQDNDYIINFENLELVYNQKQLFKDRGLLNNVDGFLSVFVEDPILMTVTDEKGEGRYVAGCRVFPNNSEFHYIDNHILPDSNYSFLDDMGDEWADFIMLRDSKISFIHAKHDDSIMSASAFQIVVAQALKNIGNFKPANERLDNKQRSLVNPYRIDGIITAINKLRTGANLNDAIERYKNLLVHPNLQREIIIVIDFISKAQLTLHMQQLRDNEAFPQRNQVIQILWMISGLVNCCMENGISIHIRCKP